MYRILSGGRISWGYVIYGSFIAAVLFTFGKKLLGWYLVYASPASPYGAAGSLVVFLMWVYYSSQILFFGAELIQARRTRHKWLTSEPPPSGSAAPSAS
jgi:membrane protein